MNGSEHYREAEELLAQAARNFLRGDDATPALAAAQVHATLALTAALTASAIDTEGGSEEPGKRHRITWQHLESVAKVYRTAAMKGEPPTRAVADHFSVAHSTAAKWVGHARRRGAMPPVENDLETTR